MKYQLPTGKVINIPDDEIKKSMKALDLNQIEAVQLWLEDNDYMENEEQNELDKKAKSVKIIHDAKDTTKEKKERKPRTSKVSDEKKSLFETILINLDRNENVSKENIEILKENKLILVKIGEKQFKIDLIEVRNKK